MSHEFGNETRTRAEEPETYEPIELAYPMAHAEKSHRHYYADLRAVAEGAMQQIDSGVEMIPDNRGDDHPIIVAAMSRIGEEAKKRYGAEAKTHSELYGDWGARMTAQAYVKTNNDWSNNPSVPDTSAYGVVDSATERMEIHKAAGQVDAARAKQEAITDAKEKATAELEEENRQQNERANKARAKLDAAKW